MESVFIILLFVAPGLILNVYNKKMKIIATKENSGATVYEQLSEVVIHSIIITAMTIIVYRKWCGFADIMPPKGFKELISELDSFAMLAAYMGICIAITIIWMVIYHFVRKPIFALRKYMIEKESGIEIADINELTVWENIFLSKESNEKRKIISIYHNGEFVTAGESYGVNTGKSEKHELRILNSDTICELFKEDKEKGDAEKLFRNIEFEYFDAETGLLIKFHNPEKLEKHWEKL